VVEKVRVALYLQLSALILTKTVVAMDSDFYLKTNVFEFFIEKFDATSVAISNSFASGSTVPPAIKKFPRGTVAQRIACLFFCIPKKKPRSS
jgi:hypothetical protein